jgi:hypothetical protein
VVSGCGEWVWWIFEKAVGEDTKIWRLVY